MQTAVKPINTRGCRLIPILKVPTSKQAYPAEHLAFQPELFCQICLFFFRRPLGRKNPFFGFQDPLSQLSCLLIRFSYEFLDFLM